MKKKKALQRMRIVVFAARLNHFIFLLSPLTKMSVESKRVRNIDKLFSGKITKF